jgi:hypothetical protein
MQETTRQILQQELHNSDAIYFSDLIELRRTSKGKKISRENIVKIIRMYFDIISENILNGYQHDLERNKGYFEVVKTHLSSTKKEIIRTKYEHHPRHIFEIRFCSKKIDKFGMKFHPSIELKKRLDKKLENVNTDYKLKDGTG